MNSLVISCIISFLSLSFAQSQSLPYTIDRDYHALTPLGSVHNKTRQSRPYIKFLFQNTWLAIITPRELMYDELTNTWHNSSNGNYSLTLILNDFNRFNDKHRAVFDWRKPAEKKSLTPLLVRYKSLPQVAANSKVDSIIQELIKALPIDASRIYINWFSNDNDQISNLSTTQVDFISQFFPNSVLVLISSHADEVLKINVADTSTIYSYKSDQNTGDEVKIKKQSNQMALPGYKIPLSNFHKINSSPVSKDSAGEEIITLRNVNYEGIRSGKDYILYNPSTERETGHLKFDLHRMFRIFDVNGKHIGFVEINKSGRRYKVYDLYGHRVNKKGGMNVVKWSEIVLALSLVGIAITVLAAN